MDRRRELESWIGRSQHNQRVLGIGIAAAMVIALGLTAWHRPIGLIALAIIAIVAVCGFWVLAAHIADWRGKLDRLDDLERRDLARASRERAT
jgi:hypothetical protein